MDIEKLIEEQKKTREALRLMKESKTYEELLKKITEKELDYQEILMMNFDNWDYEASTEAYDMMAARFIFEAVDNFGKAKTCLSAVKNHYEGAIKEWEEYREYCKKLPKGKKRSYWKTMYSNPVCLKFFEDYEKANGIENSIYKEAYGGGE